MVKIDPLANIAQGGSIVIEYQFFFLLNYLKDAFAT
jgi:hypothetical protein